MLLAPNLENALVYYFDYVQIIYYACHHIVVHKIFFMVNNAHFIGFILKIIFQLCHFISNNLHLSWHVCVTYISEFTSICKCYLENRMLIVLQFVIPKFVLNTSIPKWFMLFYLSSHSNSRRFSILIKKIS